MITLSHPTVNGYVRALLQALDEIGELQEFDTTLAVGRREVKIAHSKIRQHPHREVLRLLGQRLRQDWLIRHESGWASVDAVAQEFDRQVSKRLSGTARIYCYENSGTSTFPAACCMDM